MQETVDLKTANTELVVYADGGSRGNPGPAAYGFVVKNTDNQVIFECNKYLGITTNNQAEYRAVEAALQKVIAIGAKKITFRLDSQLVVNQVNGIYKIKSPELKVIYDEIKNLIKNFDQVTFTHVRREYNKEADAQVNIALDQELKGK